MAILKVQDVSVKYITGDFKSIGFKEYVLRKLKNNYKVQEFWANKNITFEIERGDMLGNKILVCYISYSNRITYGDKENQWV